MIVQKKQEEKALDMLCGRRCSEDNNKTEMLVNGEEH